MWMRVLGDATARTPVVCVPGGPGVAHDYLANLERLAECGHPVVFYDPLGAGRSTAPPDGTYSLETIRDEIEAVRVALGVSRMHLLAHSAGSFATLEYALAYPDRLASITLASPMLDIPTYDAEVRRLIAELGSDVAAAFERAELDASLRDASYSRIYYGYCAHHVCRFADAQQVFALAGRRFNADSHRALKGGFLFYTQSPLNRWNVISRLGAVVEPVLITCGAHDVLSPTMCAEAVRALPRGELVVFERSTHMQHIEEPARFIDVVAAFLERHDP